MLPNLSNAVRAWLQPLSIDRITKSIVNYQAVETKTTITFTGVVAPLSQTELEIKPEGQRNWRWLEVHTTVDLSLALDDIVVFKSRKYRVMGLSDFVDYGYYRYELAEAFV